MAIALRHRPFGALTVFLCAALLLVYVPVYPAEAAENKNGVAVRTGGSGGGYQEYLQAYEGAAYPEEPLLMSAGEAHAEEEEPSLEAIEGVEGTSVLSEEGGALIWIVEAPQAGLYSLTLEYLPVKDKASTIERSLTINGRLPFENAAHFTFYSNYVNDGVSAETGFRRDGRDNDVRPSQVESPRWASASFGDYLGLYNAPYFFYLEAGRNVIRLEATLGSIWIHTLVFAQPKAVRPYAEVAEEYRQKGYTVVSGEPLTMQGEWASGKSDPMLYPTTDRSSCTTQPSSPTKIRLSTIGGSNWKSAGQSCTWTVKVERTGLYAFSIKFRQNLARGIWSSRRLTVDGKVPFQEAEAIRFQYAGGWQNLTLTDREGGLCYLYLEEGVHDITLTATVGDLADILGTASDSVSRLNYAYRQLLMVLGSSPDYYRDYQLEKQAPEALAVLTEQAAVLDSIGDDLFAITGKRGTLTSIIEKLAALLHTLSDNPKLIQRRWADLKSNISSFADWILDAQEQPLEIDYLLLLTEGHTAPKANGNLLQNIWHEIRSLVGSFIEDYNSIGDVSDSGEAVTVWVQAGRDQAQIIKNMVSNHFTAETGISINVQLVQGVLLQAIISGRAPDICLNLGSTDPMNLAMRGALVDLSGFEGYAEVEKRFYESAVVPFRFGGAVYALPETQTFPMMFYRTDIFEELELELPETWEELIHILPIIQRRNMDVGVDAGSYNTFLFQFGGDLYTPGGSACIADSETGINAFDFFTLLFVDYQLPLSYNFVNRFRTGEMPLGIADYSTYNTLAVFAPEIRGLWKMAPVPGTLREDGVTVDHTAASGSTGAVMLANCAEEKRENAWRFLDWWTSADMQQLYGKEMESLLGVSARYTSANVEAVSNLAWTAEDKASLFAQWEWTRGVPEVPGSYFTARHMNNAFRQVVYHGEDARDILSEYIEIINNEITAKRKEFGLDAGD